jgi:hypothetical protein
LNKLSGKKTENMNLLRSLSKLPGRTKHYVKKKMPSLNFNMTQQKVPQNKAYNGRLLIPPPPREGGGGMSRSSAIFKPMFPEYQRNYPLLNCLPKQIDKRAFYILLRETVLQQIY